MALGLHLAEASPEDAVWGDEVKGPPVGVLHVADVHLNRRDPNAQSVILAPERREKMLQESSNVPTGGADTTATQRFSDKQPCDGQQLLSWLLINGSPTLLHEGQVDSEEGVTTRSPNVYHRSDWSASQEHSFEDQIVSTGLSG